MKLGINERLKGKKLYKEVWKPVITDKEDYTGLYEVSNIGRVRIVKTGKIKKSRKNKVTGYEIIDLSKNNKQKTYGIHRLVAFAFVEGYFEGACVDHINTCKTKNIWTNLRWTTVKENSNNPLSREHNSEAKKGKTASEETRRKMSEARSGDKHWNYGNTWDEDTKKQNMLSQKNRKPVICVETGIIYPSANQAGRELGTKGCRIRDAITHRNGIQTHKGFHWAYYEEVV